MPDMIENLMDMAQPFIDFIEDYYLQFLLLVFVLLSYLGFTYAKKVFGF